MKRLEPYARTLLRIVAGVLFTCHGLQKVAGMFGGVGGGAAAIGSLAWFAGVLEIVGGPLVALGLFTRPAAIVLCGEMAVAYFHVHASRGIWPIRNGGELAALYCFIYFYLFASGPGPLSLDHLARKAKS